MYVNEPPILPNEYTRKGKTNSSEVSEVFKKFQVIDQ